MILQYYYKHYIAYSYCYSIRVFVDYSAGLHFPPPSVPLLFNQPGPLRDVRLEAQGLVQREQQVRLVEKVRADMREMEVATSVGGGQSVLGFKPTTETRKYAY